MRSDSLRIVEPCSADWERMDGDGRARFCRLCHKDVTDLSTMSQEEAEAFLTAGDQPCVRYVHDARGDIVFKDRVGLLPRLAAAASLAFGALAGGGCLMGKAAAPGTTSTPPPTSPSEAPRAPVAPSGPKAPV
jgi:hypothetical protein